MARKQSLIALDIGEKRIGVALADTTVRIAIAYDTITVDGSELEQILNLISLEAVEVVVVGYPRNQSGEPTRQTEYVEQFADLLRPLVDKLVFQDESLTSVRAEELLKAQDRPFEKAEVDSLAASLILQDYLEANYG